MKCKYYDCGWCYAPPDIEINAYAGSCIEPLSCPYLTGNKTLMTTQKEQQLKEMTNQIPCNHRTPPKYNVEYLDDKMVIVNGIQYQKVEKPKQQPLYRTLIQKTGFSRQGCESICNIVRDWLIYHTVIEAQDAEKVTFTIHKEQLQTPK